MRKLATLFLAALVLISVTNKTSAAAPGKSSTNYEYLIITDSDLYDPANPDHWGTRGLDALCARKLEQGLRSEIHFVGDAEVGSTFATIRAFIHQQRTERGVAFVLLAGDLTVIPKSDAGYDYYYSVPAGDTGDPVVMVGRFPVRYNEAYRLYGMIERSLAFEAVSPTDPLYDDLLIISAKDNESDPGYEHDTCSVFDRIADGPFGDVAPDLRRFTGDAARVGGCGAYLDSNQDILDQIDYGARMVMYRGHGWPGYWSNWDDAGMLDFGYEGDNVYTLDALQNTTFPIVLSGACDNARLGTWDYPSLAEQFMKPDYNDHGAASFVGFTGSVHKFAADKFVETMADAVYGLNRSHLLGMATRRTFQAIASMPLDAELRDYSIDARMMQVYGDPALQILPPSATGTGPLLLAPADLAYLYPFEVELSWFNLAGAVRYEIEVATSTDPSFDAPRRYTTDLTTLPLPNELPTLINGACYLWRVCAVFGDESRSEWSETRRLNEMAPYPAMDTRDVYPRLFTLLDVSQPFTITWGEMARVTTWKIEIYGSASAKAEVPPLFSYTVTGQSKLIPAGTLLPGSYAWRLRAVFPNYLEEVHWGDWAPFEMVEFGPTSCPVLSVSGPDGWQDVNPLLTQCEDFGYKRIVSDFHDITPLLQAGKGDATLQLREQEKEVTRLDDFGLVVVSNPDGLPVGATPDGEFFAITGAGPRILAADQAGVDLTAGGLRASGSGRFDFTLAAGGGDVVIALGTPIKLPCPAELPTEDPGTKSAGYGADARGLAVYALQDGAWTELMTMPYRKNETLEYVVLPAAKGDRTYRLAWNNGVALTSFRTFAIDRSAVEVTYHRPDNAALKRAGESGAAMPSATCDLHLGDAAVFGFSGIDLASAPEGTRVYAYAKGYYYPAPYEAAQGIVPTAGLVGIYPNPCNPLTNISFRLDAAGPVDVAVYNVRGERVFTVATGIWPAGEHRATWAGANDAGDAVASGVYFVRFDAGSVTQTSRVVLVK